jgi:hypothetical protein
LTYILIEKEVSEVRGFLARLENSLTDVISEEKGKVFVEWQSSKSTSCRGGFIGNLKMGEGIT